MPKTLKGHEESLIKTIIHFYKRKVSSHKKP